MNIKRALYLYRAGVDDLFVISVAGLQGTLSRMDNGP